MPLILNVPLVIERKPTAFAPRTVNVPGAGREVERIGVTRALIQTHASRLLQIGIAIASPRCRARSGKCDLHAGSESARYDIEVYHPAVGEVLTNRKRMATCDRRRREGDKCSVIGKGNRTSSRERPGGRGILILKNSRTALANGQVVAKCGGVDRDRVAIDDDDVVGRSRDDAARPRRGAAPEPPPVPLELMATALAEALSKSQQKRAAIKIEALCAMPLVRRVNVRILISVFIGEALLRNSDFFGK